MVLDYRLGVGIMLVSQQGKVFIGKRLGISWGKGDAWQMPQGGIDEGEEPRDAAFRELYEEVGVDNVELIKEKKDWLSYDLPAELVPNLWNGIYRGQKQKWFLMRFLGEDHEINISTEMAEFSDWRWESPEKLPDLIVDFKKDLYSEVVRDFLPLIPS